MGIAKGLENKICFLGRIEHACGATVIHFFGQVFSECTEAVAT